MNRVADTWAEAADIAAAGGIVVAWEFRPRSIFSKLSDVCVLHQKVDQPNFKILFDTANAHACCVAAAHQHGHRETSACGLPELLKKLEGRVGGIHVMDSDTLPPGAEGTTHRPFEEGVIDFRILGPQLLEAPVHWWCVDLSYCPGAWDLLESSREYVVALMAAKTAA
jgi:sugar phosphate isomerase/epimerase